MAKNEPSLRDLKKAGLELNDLIKPDPRIKLDLEEEEIKEQVLEVAKLIEPGDRMSEELIDTLEALGWEAPKVKPTRGKAKEEVEVEEPEDEPKRGKERGMAKREKVKEKVEETKSKKKAPPQAEVEVPKGTLTVQEAMEKFDKSKREIRILGRTGEVDVKKVGTRVFYPEKALTDYFKKSSKKTSKKEAEADAE